MSLPQPSLTIPQHVRRTLALAIPVMIARCGLIVMVTVSTIMAGQADSIILAQYAASFPPHITLLVLGIGLMAATTILTAQATGADRPAEVGTIWRTSLLVGGALGLIEAFILSFGPAILLLLDQPAALAEPGGRALQMFAFGMPGMFLFLATTNFLEGIGRPKVGMVITLSANVLSALLNWLLIEGNWGFPGMGAAGAALATTITRWVMFGAALLYVLTLMPDRRYYGLGWGPMPLQHVRRQLRLGLPLGLSLGLQTAAMALITSFAGWLGPVPIAAYQICNNVVGFIFMLSLGLSTATAVRVANAIGRGDAAGRATAGWVGFGLVLTLQVMTGGLILLIRPWLARAYTPDPEVLALVVPGMALVAFIVICDGAQSVLQGALRACGDVMRPLAIYMVAYWIVGVPLAYLLGHKLGWNVQGLLTGVAIGFLLAATAMALRFRAVNRHEVRPI